MSLSSVLRAAVVVAALGLAPSAEAVCPATAADLGADLSQATGSFTTMDAAGFSAGHSAAIEDLSCMQEQLAPADAAVIHRVEAFAGFLGRDAETVKAAFRASIAIQPAYQLPTNLAPPGSPLDQRYAEARQAPASATMRVQPPGGATLYVDGTRSNLVPTERPAVLQLVGPSGTVDWTGWVRDLASAPEWARTPAAEVVATTTPEVVLPVTSPITPAPQRSLKVPLLAGAGGVAVVSGGLLVAGLSARARFHDPETPFEDVTALHNRANAFGLAAQGGLVVAVGLGTVAIVFPL